MPALRVVRLVTVLSTCGLMAGCNKAQQPEVGSRRGTAVPELGSLSPRQQTLLYDWLFCHECTDAERDSAQSAIQDAVPVLDRILTKVPATWVDNVSQRLERIAADLALDSAASLVYRNHYLGNLHATVQSRTALLLGDIGTPPAIDALWRAADSAGTRGYRSDVVGAVTSSLLSGARRASPASIPDSALQVLNVDSLPDVIMGRLSMTAEPTSQVQYFRLAPPQGSTIGARVEWTNPSAIDLVWDDCQSRREFTRIPPAVSGTADGPVTRDRFQARVIRPQNPNSISDSLTIPAGGCRLLGLVKTDTVTTATVYRLRLSATPQP